jgi:hypothetical protein
MALQAVADASTIMAGFTAATALSDTARTPRRYLWTDAFAVCNFLELYRQTGEARYQRWALELARASHAAFTCQPVAGGSKRMYWKMSIDLSRPLVPSMGHHDPLDGLLTCIALDAAVRFFGSACGAIGLTGAIADFRAMCAGKSWATDDPLGTGGLLVDAFRIAQLRAEFGNTGLPDLAALLADSAAGLDAFADSGTLGYPATLRLPFREFGLSIGLHAVTRLQGMVERQPGQFTKTERRQLESVRRFAALSGVIERFWLQADHQRGATWQQHADINAVMLATSLAPDGYLSDSQRRE